MKTLLRWIVLLLALIVARVLLALALLAGAAFLIDAGLQSLGLPVPSQQEIAQRLDAAREQLAPLLARIHGTASVPQPANFAPASAAR